MAANDARAIPIFGYKWSVPVTIFDTSGARFAAALTGLSAELAGVDATFTALTAPTEIGTNKSTARVDVTAAQSALYSGNILVGATNTNSMVREIAFYPERLIVSRSGTAQAGTTTTLQLAAATSLTAGQIVGTYIGVLADSPSGPAGEVRKIISHTTGSGATVTVDRAFSTAPTATSTYEQGQTQAFELNASVVTDVAAAVWNATRASYTGSGTFGETNQPLPATSAQVTAAVGPLATATALTTVGSNVTGIKTKTDQLTFTVANVLNANTLRFNGVVIAGAGTTGNPWGL